MELDSGQLNAISRLKNGSILVGGVGSGKSRTGLTYFFCKECGGKICINAEGDFSPMTRPKDLYIITTAKKRDDKEWEKELIPFMLYPIETAPIKIVIDSWQNLPKYVNVTNSFFILDEQRLVSYGKWARSFIRISKSNRWILLSATPADKWEDLAPIFIANGFYHNITEFRQKHLVYNSHVDWPQVSRYINQGRLMRLREEIYVDLDYKTIRNLHHENVIVSYDKEMYNKVVVKRWNPFTNEPIENPSQLGYVIRNIINCDESRIDAVTKLISENPKSIIFYNFDYELDLLRLIAKKLQIEKAEWNGHIHQPVPQGSQWVYLVQYTAGAEGWNCKSTNTIIFYSQNYSYKTMVQAAGRIDRRDSPYMDLYYYHIISKSPIDIAIYNTLKQKKKFNEKRFFNF